MRFGKAPPTRACPANSMNTDSIQRLSLRYPECKVTLGSIERLCNTTRQFPFLEFVEHLAAILTEDGKPSLAFLTPDLLATWITHMSHGTRVRMEVLKDAVLDGLAGERVRPEVGSRSL